MKADQLPLHLPREVRRRWVDQLRLSLVVPLTRVSYLSALLSFSASDGEKVAGGRIT